ncbi:MAG: hypothetical protein GY832_11170 [Chloroflexi bacterium]|nr:hypothetical protein [Chloroflexota bacterium]
MKVKISVLLDLVQTELEAEEVSLVRQGALRQLGVFRRSLSHLADKTVEISKPKMSGEAKVLLKGMQGPDGSESADVAED